MEKGDGGGAQTGDMNSLILLVKKTNPSVGLLFGTLEFIECSKGWRLVGKAENRQ